MQFIAVVICFFVGNLIALSGYLIFNSLYLLIARLWYGRNSNCSIFFNFLRNLPSFIKSFLLSVIFGIKTWRIQKIWLFLSKNSISLISLCSATPVSCLCFCWLICFISTIHNGLYLHICLNFNSLVGIKLTPAVSIANEIFWSWHFLANSLKKSK